MTLVYAYGSGENDELGKLAFHSSKTKDKKLNTKDYDNFLKDCGRFGTQIFKLNFFDFFIEFH